MSTKLKIKVTKDVLQKSKYCGILESGKITENCAIAVAVRGIFPRAHVNHSNIVYSYGTQETGPIVSQLPYKAKEFISVFDKSTPDQRVAMPELEFEVSVPDAVIDTINIEDIKKCATLELVN